MSLTIAVFVYAAAMAQAHTDAIAQIEALGE